jgi:hypothetical protein
MGFPALEAAAAYSVSGAVNVGVMLNAFVYDGAAWEPMAVVNVGLLSRNTSSVGLHVAAGYTFFSQSEAAEDRGARWITGQRDIDALVSVVATTSGLKGIPLFVEVGVEPTVDLNPLPPQAGRPSTVNFGANVPIHMGIELPLGRHLNFVTSFGFDLHGRFSDSFAMPFVQIGVDWCSCTTVAHGPQ